MGWRGYSKYENEVTNTFIKKACKKYGLSVWGAGGSMPYDVESIVVDFAIKEKGSIDSARVLLVKLREELVEVVNNHEKIRPYLREYPFTPERAKISIDFKDKNGVSNSDVSVSLVLVGKGEQVVYTSKNEKGSFTDLHRESYEIAESIVHATDNKKLK